MTDRRKKVIGTGSGNSLSGRPGISGYTIIEILIAAGVVALVLAISVPLYQSYVAESRTVDALNAYKALELEVKAPAVARDGLAVCDNSLVSAQNLQSEYLDLSITPAPNDMAHPNGPAGYAAALNVRATVGVQGRSGIDVANLFYEEIKNTSAGSIIDGVKSDSAVAYSVRLSDPATPFCNSLATLASAGSGASAVTAGSPSPALNRAPVAAKDVDLGSTKEDTPVVINTGLLASASWDADGDPLTIVGVRASGGSISGDSTAGFIYTPALDFHGDDVQLQFDVSDGADVASGTAVIDVSSVIDMPVLSLSLSAEQQVLDTGSSGRAIASGLQTGGDMDAITLEFSVVGRQGGSASASTGPVIFNYGTQGDNNVISAWRPSNFTVAFQGTNYATGINIADGNNHRVTLSWEAATGVLKVFDNGVMVKSFNDVSKATSVPGSGHLVIGQKMNNPGSGGGWSPGEHYSGQVFGTTLATHVYSDQEIADAPLYSRSQGIVADIRDQGAGLTDQTGKHQVQMQGDFTSSTVHVDTKLALIPPGSEVRVSVQATPGDSDSQITGLALDGLGPLTLTDGVNSGSGSANITNWNQGALKIDLPAGFSENIKLKLTATASDGVDSASAEVSEFLRMKP